MSLVVRRKRYTRNQPKRMKTVAKVARKEAKDVLDKNTELKRVFQNSIAFNAYAGAVPYLISGTAQGLTDTSRIGDSIKPKHLYMNWVFRFQVDTVVRVMVFQWFPSDATAPGLTDIFENATYPTLSEYRVDNKDKFRIIYDKKLTVHAHKQIVNLDLNKKLQVRKIQYNAGTVNGTGNLYSLVLTNDVFVSATPYDERRVLTYQDI